jgi:hypothetical protein
VSLEDLGPRLSNHGAWDSSPNDDVLFGNLDNCRDLNEAIFAIQRVVGLSCQCVKALFRAVSVRIRPDDPQAQTLYFGTNRATE